MTSSNGHGEFVGQIERKAPKAECPFCRNEVWAPADARSVLLPLDDDGQPVWDQGRAVFPLACTTCGFVRLHDIEFLSEDDN